MISFPWYLCQVGTYLTQAFVLLIMTHVFIWRKPQKIVDLDVEGHAGLYGFHNRSCVTVLPRVVYLSVHFNIFC